MPDLQVQHTTGQNPVYHKHSEHIPGYQHDQLHLLLIYSFEQLNIKRKVPCKLVMQGTLELKGEIAENRLCRKDFDYFLINFLVTSINLSLTINTYIPLFNDETSNCFTISSFDTKSL
jgi:hypothetical protein